MRLWDLYEEWLVAARAENFSIETIRSKRFRLKSFVQYMEANGLEPDTNTVTPRVIREFIAASRDTYSPYTVTSNVRVLKTLFRFGVREGLISEDPTTRIPVPKVPTIDYTVFDPSDIDTLLQACDQKTLTGLRDFAIVMLLFDSGIRASELVGMTDDSVNWERGLIHVYGKGAKERSVPVSGRTLRAIRRYQNQRNKRFDTCQRLFANHRGEVLTRSGLLQMLVRLGKKTGLHCFTHKMRHSFAVNALRNDAREFDIQDCLGHTTLTMTKRYAKQTIDDLAIRHKRFSPADRLRTRV